MAQNSNEKKESLLPGSLSESIQLKIDIEYNVEVKKENSKY